MSIVEGSTAQDDRPEGRGGESWLERYRPQCLDDMALDPKIKHRIAAYLASGNVPSLILHGPPGTGKSTIARIIVNALYPTDTYQHVFWIPAVETGNADYIREKVIPWLTTSGGFYRLMSENPREWRRAIVFSEADGLSKKAQEMLKDVTDTFDNLLVIFTTNHLDSLDPALYSRCKVIEMPPPPVYERSRILAAILDREGVVAEEVDIVRFAEAHPDMRDLLREAEFGIVVEGTLAVKHAEAADERWPEPVAGHELLAEVAGAFSRYISLQPGAANALAAWAIFTHVHEAFGYSPILAVTSPVKRSGKTRLFEVLSQLVAQPMLASNVSPATVYRLGGVRRQGIMHILTPQAPPLTLFADEGDTWMRLRTELRGILNSGHTRRFAYVMRITDGAPTQYSTFYPKAIALIDSNTTGLAETLLDRSIVIPMLRRTDDEQVSPLRFDRPADDLAVLHRKAARWAYDNFETLRDADPPMPAKIRDRMADNWRPLFAIAELAGADWPDRMRESCFMLAGVIDESGDLAVALLRDICSIFESLGADRIPTKQLLKKLAKFVDQPWVATLTDIKLAEILRPFRIVPKCIWGQADENGKQGKRGYFRRDFQQAFDRYVVGGAVASEPNPIPPHAPDSPLDTLDSLEQK